MSPSIFTVGRVVVASICGIIQFMSVMGGVFFWKNFARDSFPDIGFLKSNAEGIAAMLGLISLLWPMYVFAAAKDTFVKNTNRKNDK